MNEKIKKRISEIQGKNSTKKIPKIIYKFLIVTVLFLVALIYTKSSPENKLSLYKLLYEDTFKFTKVNNTVEKYLGDIEIFDNLLNTSTSVFKEDLKFSDANKYKDGAVLTVNLNYLIPILESGIIVFIGEKDEYGSTVIVQQIDGIDMWYGNIKNINAQMYEYVEKGSLLAETKDEKLYVVWEENGEYKDYKEYLE